MREAFETLVAFECLVHDFDRGEHGEYLNSDVQSMWIGYEAGRQAARAQGDAEPVAWWDGDTGEPETAFQFERDNIYAIPVFAHLPKAQAVPNGWKLVPEEPAEEMTNAAMEVLLNRGDIYENQYGEIVVETITPRHLLKAMLTAAPLAAEQQPEPDVSGLVEAAEAALEEIENIMHEAYNSAYPVCCGRVGSECCGSPEPEWDEADQRMTGRLAPHQKALRIALAAHRKQEDSGDE